MFYFGFFWRQINSLRTQNVKFFPLLVWFVFAVINPFSWIMNAFSSEKHCRPLQWLAHMQIICGFKVHDLITCKSKIQGVVALGRHWVLFALGCHWVLTNGTWYVLLQSENVFELGAIMNKIFMYARPYSIKWRVQFHLSCKISVEFSSSSFYLSFGNVKIILNNPNPTSSLWLLPGKDVYFNLSILTLFVYIFIEYFYFVCLRFHYN